MPNFFQLIRFRLNSNQALDLALERPLSTFSKKLWPWPDSKLVLMVALIITLDYVSTYAFLTFGDSQVAEGGLLAGWALQTGGFLKLFFIDAAAVGGLILLSMCLRSLYCRLGLPGLGRTAFVFLLVPYFIVTLAVVYNNIFWALF